MVTMGCPIDSLDIYFGIQLADYRDIGVIYAQGLIHVFILLSLVETLGHSLKFFVLDWIL